MSVRNLKDFIGQIEHKEPEVPNGTLRPFADKWLESTKPHLKESSYVRRLRAC